MVGEPEMSHELQHSEYAANSIKAKATQLYPQLDFGAERIRNRPDPETRVLINNLYELGKAKKDKTISPQEIEQLAVNWRQGVNLRLENGIPIILDYLDFHDLDLSGMDLSDISFAGADLSGTKMSHTKLDRTKFMFANLEDANLDYTTAEGALFINAIMTNTSISNARMNGVYLYADLSMSHIKNSELNPEGFFAAKIEGAQISGFNPGWTKPEDKTPTKPLPDESLTQDQKELLAETDKQIERYRDYLTQTKGRKLDPVTQEIYDELVRICSMKKKGKYDRDIVKTKLEWAYKKNELGKPINFDGLDLHGLDLSFLDLSGISFVGASFEGSDVTLTNISGTNCAVANFRNTKFIFSDLKGAFVIGTDFTDADLTATRMRQSLYARTKFTGAKFENTDIKDAVLLGADFSGADIQQSSFTGSSPLNGLKNAQVLRSVVF